MSFKSFVVACRGAPRGVPHVLSHVLRLAASPVRAPALRARAAGGLARLHALLATPAEGFVAHGCGVPRARWVRAGAVRQLTRAAAFTVRTALRVGWSGRPLTPCGYAVLALVIGAIVLAIVIATSPAGDELDSALPLSWWFA